MIASSGPEEAILFDSFNEMMRVFGRLYITDGGLGAKPPTAGGKWGSGGETPSRWENFGFFLAKVTPLVIIFN